MTEIGYYNYFNDPHRYSPDTVQDRYAQMVERYNSSELHANNDNPYSELNLARRELDEKLAPMASALRDKFKSANEVHQYLSRKYFGTDDFAYTKKFSEPEKYAMFENDYNAICFGTVGGANLNDPRINYTQQDWESYEAEAKASEQASISGQMKRLLEKSGINLQDDLIISFNPYDFSVSVNGSSNPNMLSDVAKLLSSGRNSKELMYYAIQHSAVDKDSLTKFHAWQNVMDYTGYDLSKLLLRDNEFYTSSGEKITDILKDRLDKNTALGIEHKGAAYNYVENLLDDIAEKGWNGIPDLDVKIGYSPKFGFYNFGTEYEV